jgi:hypothetical protein
MAMTAITSRICMIPPALKPIYPISQAVIKNNSNDV